MPNVSKIVNLRGQIFYLMADQVNGHTVQSDIPANAQFTDTTYDLFTNTSSTKKDIGGTVPFPSSAELADDATHRFLNAQGNWVKISTDGQITYKAESTLSWVKDGTGNQSVKMNDVENNNASSNYSFVAGQGTSVSQNYQVALGKYNKVDQDSIFMIGNGTQNTHDNIFGIGYDGNIYLYLNQQSDELTTAITDLWGANALSPLLHTIQETT